MAKKILFSALNTVVLVICILSCLFRWYVPGWILLAVAVGWFGYQTVMFCLKESLWGLIAPGTWILLCVCGWLPLALAGFGNLDFFQVIVIFGAVASGLTIPFYFYK